MSLLPQFQVILSLSATIDYKQLAEGILAVTSLHKSHPDVQIKYDPSQEFCTVHGVYSKVQAALAHLINHSPNPQSAGNKDSDPPAPSGSRSVSTAQKSLSQDSQDQSRKHHKQREQRDKVHTVMPCDEHLSSSYKDPVPSGYGKGSVAQPGSPAVQHPKDPTTLEEDFSLMVDADMFQYLKKYCHKEYEYILNKNGVEVIDVTNQGLTTLFLQIATGQGEDGQEEDRLKLAKMQLSTLYHENETKIRRAQLSKHILSPRGGLQRAMDNLSVKFPRLLLNEDDRNIYIIGNSKDVSEAKQFLLLDHSQLSGKKDDVASLLRFPSNHLSSLNPADDERIPLTSSTEVSLVDKIDQTLRSEEDERRLEGNSRYKLAARFKDLGIPALSSRPTDSSLRGLSPSSRQTHRGPMLGNDIVPKPAEVFGERVSAALGQNTGGDILFKSGNASSSVFLPNTLLRSNSMDTRPKSSTSALSTPQSNLSGSVTLPPAESASTLRRASSFSGTPQRKAQVTDQRSKDDSSNSTVSSRAGSSSFSSQAGADKQEIYENIIVSGLMWKHIKEAYSTRLDDLTSDVQIKESRPEGTGELTVTIRGANTSTVSSCKLELQKLVDSVFADFTVKELQLSKLGITDPANETLDACCAEVRSRFKKVTILVLKKSLYLLGPEPLCSKVAATLCEVFSADLTQISEQQAASNWNPSTFSQKNEDQISSLHSDPKVKLDTQTGKGGDGQERRTNHRSDSRKAEVVKESVAHSSVRKDPVIIEKVKATGTIGLDGKTDQLFSHSGQDRSVKRVNGVGSTADCAEDTGLEKKERTKHSTPKDTLQQNISGESRSGQGDLGWICTCGENGRSVTRTKCGVTMCSKCLDTVHSHCRVCHETVQTTQGINGKMSCSTLPISVRGHLRDPTIKITYCIPDGIQGVSRIKLNRKS